MGFQQGLSGLNSSAKALDAISNNIANSGTAGFKAATTRFSDVYAASLGGGGSSQVGIGASLASVFQQFTQGNVTTTNNPMDVAINGQGLFRMNNNGTITYTRNGQFQVDKDGYVVNSAGLQLTGYAADAVSGAIIPGNTIPLQVNNTNIAPQVSTTSQIQVNLDSRSTPPSSQTSGTLTGSTTPTLPTAAGTLIIDVDGIAVTVTIPAGISATGTLVTTLESLINADTSMVAAGASVDVTTTTSGALVISSNSKGSSSGGGGYQGSGSTVTLTGGTQAANLLGAAPVSVSGADNFNPRTAGYVTGSVVVTNALASAVVAGSTVDVTIDGAATVAAVDIGTAGGYTTSTIAAGVQNKINTALAAAGQNGRVTVTINSSNQLVITSNSTGTGSTVALANLQANVTGVLGTPAVTPGGVNLTSVNSLGFTASTAQTVYDSLGNAHNLSLYFVKNTLGNHWQLYTTLDGAQQQGPTPLVFNGTGALTTSMPLTLPAANNSYIFTNGADPLQFTLDLTGTTQYGIAFGVNQLTQDGYASGRLSGVSISPDGTFQGRYSNGKSKTMGQLVLVSFNNPNGLQSMGGNQWAETSLSGQPIPGTPGSGSLGVVQSAATEDSNVDLTAELVAMITQQRSYQASAQSIKTQDQVLSTLVNLR